MRMTSSVALLVFVLFPYVQSKCSQIKESPQWCLHWMNRQVHLFCLCLAEQQGQVHCGFAGCRLVQERSWLIACSLGCLFMRLCKCVRHQQGKANSSGPSNWIYTCGRRPGFIWNKRLYSAHPTQAVLLLNNFNSLTSALELNQKRSLELVLVWKRTVKNQHILYVDL